MNRRQFSLWQKAAALGPLLLLLVYLPGEMMMRCQMDGMLRPACCCPEQGEAKSPGPVLKAQSCCDRVVTETDRPTAEAARPAHSDLVETAAVAFVASSVATLTPPAARPDWAWQRHGPVGDGPPLVLLKHAFLI